MRYVRQAGSDPSFLLKALGEAAGELNRAFFGIPELGAVLSCNRDASLIDGFNPDVRFTRTQTIMQGAPCCDFRYEQPGAPKGATS